MVIRPATAFQARWEMLPASLRPPVLTTAQKVWRIAWNVISVLIPFIGLFRLAAYGLGRLALKIILPAASYTEWEKFHLRDRFTVKCAERSSHFEAVHQTVFTPDGAGLDVTLFRHRQANLQTPTTLFFGGNAALKEMCGWDWLLKESIDRNAPMNFVVFNHRTTGNSTGKFTKSNDLLVDGSSVVQWIREFVQTPNHLIHFKGMSLGAAVALKAKAADETLTGHLLHERSFSSLEDWIRARKKFLKWLTPVAIWGLKSQELELNAAIDWDRLRGRKLIVYHPEDYVVPFEASMAFKIPAAEVFELQGQSSVDDHHNSDLTLYDGAKERVSNFLFA